MTAETIGCYGNCVSGMQKVRFWRRSSKFGVSSLYGGVGDDQILFTSKPTYACEGSVMSGQKFVAYFRVSTQRQGVSGLGLDVQRTATRQFVMSSEGAITSEFTEVESGKASIRPQLQAALDLCRKTGTTLLIAKLDRLARNVAFIANLLESGVTFVAVDMPNADRFMLHVYAAMAEEEGRRISERTKAALASAKVRGVELGRNGKRLAEQHKREARRFAVGLEPVLRRLIMDEGASYRVAAERMNAMRIPSARGGAWHQTTVFRAWKRIGAEANA